MRLILLILMSLALRGGGSRAGRTVGRASRSPARRSATHTYETESRGSAYWSRGTWKGGHVVSDHVGGGSKASFQRQFGRHMGGQGGNRHQGNPSFGRQGGMDGPGHGRGAYARLPSRSARNMRFKTRTSQRYDYHATKKTLNNGQQALMRKQEKFAMRYRDRVADGEQPHSKNFHKEMRDNAEQDTYEGVIDETMQDWFNDMAQEQYEAYTDENDDNNNQK